MARTKDKARKMVNIKRAVDEDDEQTERPTKKQKSESQPSTDIRIPHDDHDKSLINLSPALIADHFAQYIKKHLGDNTTLELEARYLPASAFADTTTFEAAHTLDSLPQYMESVSTKENLMKSKKPASPHTLVIAASGIRAADLCRALRVFRSDDAAVAKLFAKHIKLGTAERYLKYAKIGFGVGTPTRVNDLLERNAMQCDDLERLVIDGSYLDEKKSSIFSMKQIFLPLLDLLNREEIKARYGKKGRAVQIMVF